MTTGWRKGKILWFDKLAGEGMAIDCKGNPIYFHHTAIKTATPLIEDMPVKFRIYENGYLRQIEKLTSLI